MPIKPGKLGVGSAARADDKKKSEDEVSEEQLEDVAGGANTVKNNHWSKERCSPLSRMVNGLQPARISEVCSIRACLSTCTGKTIVM